MRSKIFTATIVLMATQLGTLETGLSPVTHLLRRNISLILGTNVPALGVRAWGDITMTDSESRKERRNQVARYRVMAQETTDPLAACLLRDIVLDLEAELEGSPESVGLDAA